MSWSTVKIRRPWYEPSSRDSSLLDFGEPPTRTMRTEEENEKMMRDWDTQVEGRIADETRGMTTAPF